MVLAFVVRNQGGSFSSHLALVLICLALAFVVHYAAPTIHALRGWRKAAANAGMTVLALLVLFAQAHPQIVQTQVAFLMECVCLWGWESWCCYF